MIRKKTIYKLAVAIIAAVLLLCGCGGKTEPVGPGASEPAASGVQLPPAAPKEEPQDGDVDRSDYNLIETNADIAICLLRERLEKEGEKNYMFSPVSLYEILALAANGASGQTRAQLETYLGGSMESINEALADYHRTLPKSLHVANSIWVNNSIGSLTDSYQQLAQNEYDAVVEDVPFTGETVDRINAWGKKHTKGMIPSVLNELDPDQAMILLNAVAFEAKWEEQYENSQIHPHETFTNADGTTSTYTQLSSEEDEYLKIMDGENVIAKGFLKPYKNGKTAFMGIEPAEGYTLEDVMKHLNGKSYAEMYANKEVYKEGTLHAGIPEFKADDSMELVEHLKNEQVELPFVPYQADFSGMMNTDFPLYISGLFQKTHIEVDRKGTKAAAITGIVMTAESVSESVNLYIILDQPFLYAIVDYETGMPFFMGMINTME